MYELFAVTAPGVEPIARAELQRLGLLADAVAEVEDAARETGGVTFKGELADVYRANLHVRTANRILVRIGHFYATSLGEVRKKAGRLNWPRFVVPGQPVAIRVTCHQSKLYHSDAVAERMVVAISDRLGAPIVVQRTADDDATDAPQLIVVRVADNKFTVSVDSSGALLHRRGYRQALAKAPLRETLAAASVMASGWDEAAPLLDPFCGSGAIPIEAAMMAAGLAPGRQRRFAFMSWPGFDAAGWQRLLKEDPAPRSAAMPMILASDRDAGAVHMAQENAERAGVAQFIEFSRRAVSAIEPPAGPGWIVTNPPYGARVSASHDVRNLYAQFGHVLRARCSGWGVAVMCSDGQLLRQMALPLETKFMSSNGGIKVQVAVGRVPALE